MFSGLPVELSPPPLPPLPRALLQVTPPCLPSHALLLRPPSHAFFAAERAAVAAAGIVAGSASSSSAAADNLGGKRLRAQDAEIDSFMKDIDSIFGGT